jgi:uncharacterized protein YgfB (UPF0149 family)
MPFSVTASTALIGRDGVDGTDRDVQMFAESEETGLELHNAGTTWLHAFISSLGLLQRGLEFVTRDAGNDTDLLAVDVADVHVRVRRPRYCSCMLAPPAL